LSFEIIEIDEQALFIDDSTAVFEFDNNAVLIGDDASDVKKKRKRIVEASKDVKSQQDEIYHSLLVLAPIYLSFDR
jgi:hypothetical protein